MTLLAVDDAAVLAELWVSLRSLIYSYVAAHELGLPANGVVMESTENTHLTIHTGERSLAIGFVDDRGTWTLSSNLSLLSRGSFTLGGDSMVEFSDRKGKLELDVAAEAFTAKIFDEETL